MSNVTSDTNDIISMYVRFYIKSEILHKIITESIAYQLVDYPLKIWQKAYKKLLFNDEF